jgi:hypothetical protein
MPYQVVSRYGGHRWARANWKMLGLLDYTHMLVGLVSLMAVLGDQQWLQGWIDLLKDDNVRT